MDIIYLPTLIPFLKQKHLLLDSNIFRDASSKYSVFTKFFNDLKKADVTLATIDLVEYELLKGAADKAKYVDREKLIKDIIDITIPITPKTCELVYELIKIMELKGRD